MQEQRSPNPIPQHVRRKQPLQFICLRVSFLELPNQAILLLANVDVKVWSPKCDKVASVFFVFFFKWLHSFTCPHQVHILCILAGICWVTGRALLWLVTHNTYPLPLLGCVFLGAISQRQMVHLWNNTALHTMTRKSSDSATLRGGQGTILFQDDGLLQPLRKQTICQLYGHCFHFEVGAPLSLRVAYLHINSLPHNLPQSSVITLVTHLFCQAIKEDTILVLVRNGEPTTRLKTSSSHSEVSWPALKKQVRTTLTSLSLQSLKEHNLLFPRVVAADPPRWHAVLFLVGPWWGKSQGGKSYSQMK